MENDIVNHLFEFWEYIGSRGNFLNKENDYKYTNADNFSWPSKVFGIESGVLDFNKLISGMKRGKLPKSLSIAENESTEKLLLKHNFGKQSTVKGMFLDLSQKKRPIPTKDFSTIEQVIDVQKAAEFARISSISFGYEILVTTTIPLIKNVEKLKLFLGKQNNEFVSCGMIYLDRNGNSGIHMIGTLPKYRGLGLGKTMTEKLLHEAYENLSDRAVLVASKSGERIYRKIGFLTQGTLISYAPRK